ncbi:Hypothetical protein CINCED_3A021977 [Cinara cedri]|uniref:Cilia- and flagella-associated protein 45 n=1 Tax=Cinara cedri TaxID=506608 RepID=A0A5E4MG57_9HEMI|nr:Hypothetical protein CINCED_3A021977 [Cinara cedri]
MEAVKQKTAELLKALTKEDFHLCYNQWKKRMERKRMKEEKRRMVEMVEQQRILASKKYDQDMEIERLKKKKQADEIVNQMKENENTREFEAARDAQDAKIRMEAAMEAQRAVIRDHHAKLLKQAEMRQEALQINTQLKDMKKMEKDLINLEIKQIQEYNRKKAEREKAYEDLMLKQKREKEIEIAKIQASQLASQDLQAAKDELNMLRIQDQVEKEWRRKERETALKKIQINDDLREARRLQIEGQREYQAFEIQRENEEFNRIIRLNVEDMEKTKEQDRQTKLAIDEHRKNLLKQINAKEWEKIQERKDFFQEGVAYQEGEIARNKSLHETMLKKVEEIRLHNLPTKYIQGIERQLKLKE